MPILNIMALHPIIVAIFQPGPKWWTDRPTDQHFQPLSHAATKKKKRQSHTNTSVLEISQEPTCTLINPIWGHNPQIEKLWPTVVQNIADYETFWVQNVLHVAL